MLTAEETADFFKAQGLELTWQQHPLGMLSATIAGGARAIEIWRQCRQAVAQTGYWPLLRPGLSSEFSSGLYSGVGGDPGLTRQQVEQTLSQAAALKPEDFFANAAAEAGADSFDDFADPSEFEDSDEWAEYAEEMGLEPTDYKASSEFSLPFDVLSREPVHEMHLLLLPTAEGWQAAAWLQLGDWNACPAPVWHVALHRYWQQHYGAEVVGVSGDTLEMWVERPPSTEEQALVLAKEQYAYCDDIVHQGVMTLDNLAKSLLNSQIWYFWWD